MAACGTAYMELSVPKVFLTRWALFQTLKKFEKVVD